MRSILMSIHPRPVANILNRLKTKEVRKMFPIDYVGWIYIYCTKDNQQELTLDEKTNKWYYSVGKYRKHTLSNKNHRYISKYNGKVVARFYCDNVEIIWWTPNEENPKNLFENSCLTKQEIKKYLDGNIGYAINISQLEIFDAPKELSEFYKGFKRKYYKNNFAQDIHKEKDVLVQPIKCGYEYTYPLTKAPRSWCYVEVEE